MSSGALATRRKPTAQPVEKPAAVPTVRQDSRVDPAPFAATPPAALLPLPELRLRVVPKPAVVEQPPAEQNARSTAGNQSSTTKTAEPVQDRPPVTEPVAVPVTQTAALPVSGQTETRTESVPQTAVSPAAGQLRAGVVQPPVVLRQVQPVMPSEVRSLMHRDVVVAVTISIDTKGNVVSADAEPVAGINPHLKRSALEAARQWRFRPALREGVPLPSVHTVRFRFPARTSPSFGR